MGPVQLGQPAAALLGGVDLKLLDQLRSRLEQDPVAGQNGSMADVLDDHRLAQAVGADEDEVASLPDDLQAEGLLDGIAVDALGPVPVELRDRLEPAETGSLKTPLDGAVGPLPKLFAHHFLEDGPGGPPVLRGAGDEV